MNLEIPKLCNCVNFHISLFVSEFTKLWMINIVYAQAFWRQWYHIFIAVVYSITLVKITDSLIVCYE